MTKEFFSASNIKLEPSYSAALLPTAEEQPGVYPFTRGIHTDMYRERLWSMRQYSGFGSAQQTNERFHYLLAQGTTGLSVAFDLPTQMGLDCDDAQSCGEVGKVGVSISTLHDMRTLLQGIALDKVSISMTINSTAPILLAMTVVLAEQQGIDAKLLTGTVQNDILKEYIARGTYIYPVRPALRLVTDLIEFASSRLPRWNSISISGYHMREAGSDAVQELAFTFANAICYVDQLLARGVALESFAPRLAFFFNCHTDFFEEIAKFRAARRIWARIMRERFNSKDERSCQLRFHTQTAGSSLTAQQPLNNVVRTALQALAAVLGGTQSLHTNGFDEALSLPSEQSALLALRTQQIIAHESGVTKVVDALGGSFFVEELTNTIEQKVFALIKDIDSQGGIISAIEAGFPQSEIERAAYQAQSSLEEKKRLVVGVNAFADNAQVDNSASSQTTVARNTIESEQIARIKEFKSKRDTQAAQKALQHIKAAAQSNQNVMLPIIDALKADATLGEISSALKEIFGKYH